MRGKIIAAKKDSVGWLTFCNQERRNAMTLAMWAETLGALEEFAADGELRAVVLTGDGDEAFQSGADISEFESKRSASHDQERYATIVRRTMSAIDALKIPVVARIRGWCVGGGLGVALRCDLRVCSDDAIFSTPAARLGIGYEVLAVKTLAAVVGLSAVREILFAGRRYSAQEALRMGIVHGMADRQEFDRFFESYLETIVANAPLVVAASKLILRELEKDASERDYDKCHAAVQACDASADFIEGRRAFLEKRKPKFLGR